MSIPLVPVALPWVIEPFGDTVGWRVLRFCVNASISVAWRGAEMNSRTIAHFPANAATVISVAIYLAIRQAIGCLMLAIAVAVTGQKKSGRKEKRVRTKFISRQNAVGDSNLD